MAAEIQVADRQQALQVRQSFEPTTLAEAMEFSKIIADSELAPKDYRGKPANVLVAIQMGRELNVPPLQAIQGIAVINGRPSVWGDLMWALVTSHPQFEDANEEITDTSATVILKRRGRTPVTVTFSKSDAEKANLWGKQGPWTQYPKRQLQWRARTFAARDLFPDALKGMTSAEEAMDYDGKTIDSSTITQKTSSSTQTVQEDPIGPEKASEFFKAYRAHGWSPDESKKFLADTFQIGKPHNDKDSRSIPKSRFDEAMKWATTKAPVRVDADSLIDLLGFTNEEKVKFVNERKYDWSKIVADAQEEIGRRNSQEQ